MYGNGMELLEKLARIPINQTAETIQKFGCHEDWDGYPRDITDEDDQSLEKSHPPRKNRSNTRSGFQGDR